MDPELAIGIGICILISFIAGWVLYAMFRRGAQTDSMLLVRERSSQIAADVQTAADELGYDYGALISGTSLAQQNAPVACARFPDDGECSANYVLDIGGCCVAPDAKDTRALDLVGTIATEIGIGIGFDIALFATKKVATKAGLRAGQQLGSVVAVTTVRRFAIKIAVRGALFLAKALVKLTSVVGAVTILFDIMSLILDAADTGGYNNFTENALNTNYRNAAAVALQKHARTTWPNAQWPQGVTPTPSDLDPSYPMTFPLQQCFPEAYNGGAVTQALDAKYALLGMEKLRTELGDALADALENDADPPEAAMNEYWAAYDLAMNNDPHGRDDVIYEALVSLGHADKIERCRHMTSASRIGVSLSKRGVAWWNQQQRPKWFEYNDSFHPKEKPDGFVEPMAAIWTSTYVKEDTSDPGTKEKPNVTVHRLEKPTAIMLPIGPIFAYCEKRKEAKNLFGHSGGARAVEPTQFGVQMEDGTLGLMCTNAEKANTAEDGTAKDASKPHCEARAACIFTENFCTRMGLRHRYAHAAGTSDCFRDAGQVIGESIAGQTVVRDVYQAIHNLGGYVCTPSCGPTQYCENRQCHNKKGFDALVGHGNGWKCLSGLQAYGNCVECRDGRNGGHHCDGKDTRTNGMQHDCSIAGSCYCGDAWGDPEYDRCVPKKSHGIHVGNGAGYKCRSGLEAYSKCVECRDGRNGGHHCDGKNIARDDISANCDVPGSCYCEDTWGASTYDKCISKLAEGAECNADHKCLSGKCHHNRCTASATRQGCGLFNCCDKDEICHHNWCIKGNFHGNRC